MRMSYINQNLKKAVIFLSIKSSIQYLTNLHNRATSSFDIMQTTPFRTHLYIPIF